MSIEPSTLSASKRFNAREGSGVFSTIAIVIVFVAISSMFPVSMPVRALGSFLLTNPTDGRTCVAVVSMPVRALGSFLPSEAGTVSALVALVSMPVRALGSFLRGSDISFLCLAGTGFNAREGSGVFSTRQQQALRRPDMPANVSMPVRALGSFLPAAPYRS